MNVGLFFDIRGSVTKDAIRSAFSRASREHPSMRMTIVAKDGKQEFKDKPDAEVQLQCEHVALVSDVDWRQELQQMVTAHREHSVAPVYLKLVTSDGEASSTAQHFLFAVMNHAAMDGPGESIL